jgi:DNA-binding ferritin-like protein (Dps family)
MDNNHVFAEEEIKNLKNVNKKLAKCYKTLFKHIETKQFTKSFTRGKELVDEINDFIEDDIKRVQNGSVDAQSSILYISILNETKYLLLELVAIYRRL